MNEPDVFPRAKQVQTNTHSKQVLGLSARHYLHRERRVTSLTAETLHCEHKHSSRVNSDEPEGLVKQSRSQKADYFWIYHFIQMSRFHVCVVTFCRTSGGLNSNESVLNNVTHVIYFVYPFRSFIERCLYITSICVNVLKPNIQAKYM